MDARQKLDEYAEMQGWNKNKLIGWAEAADFAEWLVKNCSICNLDNSYWDGICNEYRCLECHEIIEVHER